MTKKTRVLVFPSGTEIGLEIHAALKFEKYIELYGASSVEDHGLMVFQRSFSDLPFINAPSFDEAFQNLLTANAIDYVLPAHDSVLTYLAANRDKFSATILAPEQEVCDICRSKTATYNALKGEDFIPEVYPNHTAVRSYPVFLKPDCGQGSQGVLVAKNADQIQHAQEQDASLILCEYLPGPEYTIDCYTRADGTLAFVGPRTRERIRNGISVKSRSFAPTDEILSIAQKIQNRLGIKGTWFFQLKEAADKKLKLLEVAPRVAGTMALHRCQGINFTLLALHEAMGSNVTCSRPVADWEIERSLINRYKLDIDYSVVAVDLDDTLLIDDKVNEVLLMFLYQCKQAGKDIILITRHFRDPSITLQQQAIHQELFTHIEWIQDDRTKSSVLPIESKGIFIDDSHRERSDVSAKAGWHSFAPDAVEALISWHR